jgi:predicted metal-binding protein
MPKPSVLTIAPRRPEPIFVCKKCLGRIDDGKALKRGLKSEAKRQSAARATKPPRIVMTSCMGICPKRAVVVASAATLQHGRYLLLADGDSAAKAVAILMPEGFGTQASK